MTGTVMFFLGFTVGVLFAVVAQQIKRRQDARYERGHWAEGFDRTRVPQDGE